MSNYKKIFLVWGALEVCTVLSIVVLPHRNLSLAKETGHALNLFLALLCFQLVRKEISRRNKSIFFYLGLYFFCWALIVITDLFIGRAFFKNEPYATFYHFEYSNVILYFILGLSVTYSVFDVILHKHRAYQKHIIVLSVVGGVFCYFYHPLFLDAKYVYKTMEAADYKVLDATLMKWKERNKTEPSVEAIASLVSLPSIAKQAEPEQVYQEKKLKRVSELFPYLEGKNYVLLLCKPIMMNAMFLNLACVILLLIYCLYRFSFDPPHGGYMEKIVLLLVPICSLETLHAYRFVSTTNFIEYIQTFEFGIWMTCVVDLPFLVLFILRLNFIGSPVGVFYERKIQENPTRVSRWRDVFDRLITRHFFDKHNLDRRIFASTYKEEVS